MKRHPEVYPLDPAGSDNRRWRCEACGMTGRLRNVMREPCFGKRPRAQKEALMRAIEGRAREVAE